MMAAPYLRPYLDSGIFISWLRDIDEGTLADGTAGNRHPIGERILADAEAGVYQATTSFFTMAEVYKKVGHEATALTDTENGKILAYFQNPWITWVEVEWNIGQDANKLLVEHKVDRLRPVDAIHLASALRAKCDVLLTWDGPLSRIDHPGIRIEFPLLNPGTIFESAS